MIAALATLALAEPARDDGLWAVLDVLGDEPAEVVEQVDQVRDLALAMTAGVEASEADLALLRTLREEVIELDPGALYAALPESLEGGARKLSLQGSWDDPSWDLHVGVAGPVPTGPGSLDMAVVLTPTAPPVEGSRRAWRADVEGVSELGVLDRSAVAGLWEQGLTQIEALAMAGASPRSLLQAELQGTVDRRLWAALESAAPVLAQRLSGAVVVERIGKVTQDGLQLDARIRVDASRLRDLGYTELSRYLRRLGRVFSGQFRVVDSEKRKAATFHLDTADLSMGMRMLAHDGAVVPLRGEQAVYEAALRPSDLELSLALQLDMTMRSDGMQIDITDYEVPIQWRSGPSGTEISAVVSSVPSLDLKGSSSFTGWAAELADGLFDLEGHARGVFAAVAHGPSGRGTTLSMQHGEDGALDLSMAGVIVDNGMVRFFMRLVGRHLVPSDDAVADAYRVTEALVRALDADWRDVREGLLLQ